MEKIEISKPSQQKIKKNISNKLKYFAYLAITKSNFFNLIVRKTAEVLPLGKYKKRIPVTSSVELKLKGEDSVFFYNTARCGLAKEIYWNQGKLEKHSDQLALDIAIQHSKNANLFIDVGAYTGMFAMAIAKINQKVKCVTFELVPENHAALVYNLAMNNLLSRVDARPFALGAARTQISLPRWSAQGSMATSVALDWDAAITGDWLTAQVSTLDFEFPEFDGKAVLKIDVEGFELDVLKGGAGFLKRSKPDMVCEVLRRAAPRIPEMESFLKSFGYKFYHITSDGLVEKFAITPDKHQRDWFFTCNNLME